MNLRAAASALFAQVKKPIGNTDQKERNWTSMRLIVMAAFIGLIVWNVTAKLLDPTSMNFIFLAFCLWMICRTVTSLGLMFVNAWQRVHLAEIFDKDGAITAEEKEVILGTVTAAKTEES